MTVRDVFFKGDRMSGTVFLERLAEEGIAEGLFALYYSIIVIQHKAGKFQHRHLLFAIFSYIIANG